MKVTLAGPWLLAGLLLAVGGCDSGSSAGDADGLDAAGDAEDGGADEEGPDSGDAWVEDGNEDGGESDGTPEGESLDGGDPAGDEVFDGDAVPGPDGDSGPDEGEGLDGDDVSDGDPGGDGDETADGDEPSCPEQQPHERYCIEIDGDECRYEISFCRDGAWMCYANQEHPPPMPEFEDWAWQCGVYRCSVPDVTTEPPADWQDNPLDPYVPPDPASLTGEWVMLADLSSTVPIGCERQPRQHGQASALAVSPSDPRILYAGFDRDSYNVAGVWKSVDGGSTWFEARAGLGSEGCACRNYCEYPEDLLCKYWGPGIYSLYVDPIDPDLVFASTWERGLYRTTDGGRYWARVDFPPPWTEDCMDNDHHGPMGPVGRDPAGVYHATACGDYHFASHDLGESWEALGWVGAGYYVTTWAFDPTRPERLWAGMTFPVTGTGWVHLSEDGGHTWRKMSTGIEEECLWEGITRSLAVCPAEPDVMVVSVWLCGLFISTDGGATWLRSFASPEGDGDMPVWAGFQPSDTGCRIFSAWRSSPYGLFRSDNLGQSWQQEDVPALQELAFNPFSPEALLGMVGTRVSDSFTGTSPFEIWTRY